MMTSLVFPTAYKAVFRSTFRYFGHNIEKTSHPRKYLSFILHEQNFAQLHHPLPTSSAGFGQRRQLRSKNNTALHSRHFHTNVSKFGRAYFVDHELALKAAQQAEVFPFNVHHVAFTTCPTLYDGLNQHHEDRSATCLSFNAAYVDTNPYADETVPVVLTLHGAPGSHLDFCDVISFLAEQRVRVIALNFPGFGWTPMDVEHEFLHTTNEKAAFIHDFLKAINVPRVHMIMAHSAGAYPALSLCSTSSLAKSLMLLNPGGPRQMKSLNPFWYFKLHAYLCHSPILRPLMLVFLKIILTVSKFANKDALKMSVAMETLANSNFEQQGVDAAEVRKQKLPTVMMYNEKDRAVEAEVSSELANFLGMTPEVTQRIDKESNVIQRFSNTKGDHYVRCYVFEGRGHFVMQQHPKEVTQAAMKLLKTINKSAS